MAPSASPTRDAACSRLLQPPRPNQGRLRNSCRWDYAVRDGVEDAAGSIDPRRSVSPAARGVGGPRRPARGCSRARTPGEYMPIEEDEHGGYILNSKDLRAIEYVARLAKSASIR